MKELLRELIAVQPHALAKRNILREYLQARMLQALQERGAFLSWAFLGGTALRFLFGLPRFSEDLDFSLLPTGGAIDFRKIMSNIERVFVAENYTVEIKLNDRKAVHSAFIRFPGLLHEMGMSPRRAETVSIKIDLDTNPPDGAHIETTLVRRHVTLNISHYDKASLLAGKLHAILSRPWLKGRDVYDLIWYLADRTWPEPNLILLNKSLEQTGWDGSPLTKSSWRKSVLGRLKRADWKNTLEDVRPFLERDTDAALMTLGNCRKLLGF